MNAVIRAIEYHLPDTILTNEQLAAEFPEWKADKIAEKTGILERRISSPGECSSDLGFAAAQKLFSTGICTPSDIDYLLFCTQSPDYFLPTTACLMQDRLKIPSSAGALDFNMGCSGYIFGLGLAKGLIETRQARTILFITAETYSKFIHPGDKSVRTLFGDAATATLIQGLDSADAYDRDLIGPFVYGTDGSGADNLILPRGGLRSWDIKEPARIVKDESGNLRSQENLYMNGSEIFAFTLNVVPEMVNRLLLKSSKTQEDIDLFVFHQANKFMLDHLRKKMKIHENRFFLSFEKYGNTVSSTIPIALRDAKTSGKLKHGDLVMLVGFGVGYSWGATLIRWTEHAGNDEKIS